jgi:hypothetical protein
MASLAFVVASSRSGATTRSAATLRRRSQDFWMVLRECGRVVTGLGAHWAQAHIERLGV